MAAISPLPALAAGPWYGVPLPDKTGLDPDGVYTQRDFRDASVANCDSSGGRKLKEA
jgi:hypothetical protein